MVEIVVSDMIKMCDSPGKWHTTEASKKMVAKYPEYLQGVIEGDIISSGYNSLVKQMQARTENVRQIITPKVGNVRMVLMMILTKFHFK